MLLEVDEKPLFPSLLFVRIITAQDVPKERNSPSLPLHRILDSKVGHRILFFFFPIPFFILSLPSYDVVFFFVRSAAPRDDSVPFEFPR